MANVEFSMKSNKELILAQTEEAIKTALEAVGSQAQAYATAEITAQEAVDTGRLRASITFAVSGDSPKQHTYTDKNGESYSETIDDAGDEKDHTLYLGTNVNYAPYIEFGFTHAFSGEKYPARPFIRPAVENHLSEFQQIFEQNLSKIGK